MGRSFAEIYNGIIAEKETMSNLSGLLPVGDNFQQFLTELTSTSRVARWRLFVWLVTLAIWVHEQLWDLFKAEVEERISRFRPGTLRWYQEQAFKFQYGDVLVWDDTERVYKYAVNDDSKKVVKLCAVTEPAGVVRIKVATLDGTDIVALPAIQINSLQAYFNQVKYPGPVVVVSFDADLLKISGTVKFNPLVEPNVLNAAVEAAINGYLTNLEFNGRFNVTKLIDAVQKVEGVVDFTDVQVWTKYGNLAYQLVDDEYQTNAGYAKVDTANFPLTTTLTYQPYV